MKRILAMVAMGAVALFAMSGCEWSGSGGDGGWSTTGIDSDISGAYAAQTSGSGASTAVQNIGTGNPPTQKIYSGTLNESPIVVGSVSVSDGTATISDNDGDGTMTGAGTGSINYDSGAVTVTFAAAPVVGAAINVTYRYSSWGSGGVNTFNVQQTGNKVRIVTNNGDVLEGSLGVNESTTVVSGSSTNVVATMYQFSVSGTSNGKSVTMTGVFNVGAGTMQGTWIEDGNTGSVNAKRQ